MTILPSNLRPKSHDFAKKRRLKNQGGNHQQKQGIKGGLKMLPWRSWYNLTTSNISNQVYKIHYHECWGYFRVGFSSETLPSTAICGRETSRVKKCAWSQWAAAAVQVQNFRTVFFSQNKRKREKKRQNPIPHNIGKSDYPNRQKKTTSSYNGG